MSINEFGYVEPVIWNKRTGNIVGGHQRYKILKNMGLSEVECVVLDIDEVKEKALNVALNKIGGEFDIPLLTDLLKDLSDSDFDATLTGFDLAEIDELFSKADDKEGKDDDYDVTKALQKATFVNRGDVWLLGKHRMLCGDATNPEDVAILMDGKKANLILTDPPYNVDFKSASGLKIKNDKQDSENFYNFLLSSFKNMASHLTDGGSAYTHFITALCNMAKKQNRVTAKEKSADNEKYTFRCFLLRLGFIGSEYKKERKILLRNLSGSSAFKNITNKGEPSDEIFNYNLQK